MAKVEQVKEAALEANIADAERAIEGIQELVADYGRGILDRDELFDQVRSYAIYV